MRPWLLAAVLAVGAAPVDASSLVVGAGVFGLKSHDQHDLLADLEWRGPRWAKLFEVYPVGGLFATDEGGLYARSGFGRDFNLGESWRITLTTAAGLYEPGDGRDLGHTVEFRSAIEVSYRFEHARVGLSISHLSNASISDDNPGVEVALVTVSLPLRGNR